MVWDCQCNCGKVISVAGTDLRIGKIKDCGNHLEEEK